MLMGNSPPGDVQVQIPAESVADVKSAGHAAIRVKLKRKRQTLEISRHAPDTREGRKEVGEWSKKVMPLSNGLELSGEDWSALDAFERLAMKYLVDFLEVCEAAEAVESQGGTPSEKCSDGDGRKLRERTLSGGQKRPWGGHPSRAMSGAPSGASSVAVPPRPRKFSSMIMLR